MWKSILRALVLLLALPHCQPEQGLEQRAPSIPESQTETSESSEVKAPVRERDGLKEQLARLRDKQACNRLMGCDPAIAIKQFGRSGLPEVLSTLRAIPIDGRYWQLKLIEILGQLGDTRGVEFLKEQLTQKRWEVRCRSALALAQIRDPRSIDALRQLYATQGDIATEAAALFALANLKERIDGVAAREVLIKRLPRDQEALGALNPGHYAFLAELVGIAQLRASLQLARWGAMHKDRFTRMAALESLALLKDREGIPYAITRLEDTSPGVRRQALRTLRVISAKRAFTRPEHWQDWCEQRDCLAPLRKLRDSPRSEGTIESR